MTEPMIDNPEVFIYRDVKYSIYVNPKAVGLAPDSKERMERRGFDGIWLVDYEWPNAFKDLGFKLSGQFPLNNRFDQKSEKYVPFEMDDIKALLMKEVDKTYTKKQWNNEVKAKIRKRLYDGIYGIVYGAKSKMFFIEPYQLEGLGFEADKVKRLGKAYETQNIGCGSTPLVLNCKGYDAILIGLGDD